MEEIKLKMLDENMHKEELARIYALHESELENERTIVMTLKTELKQWETVLEAERNETQRLSEENENRGLHEQHIAAKVVNMRGYVGKRLREAIQQGTI